MGIEFEVMDLCRIDLESCVDKGSIPCEHHKRDQDENSLAQCIGQISAFHEVVVSLAQSKTLTIRFPPPPQGEGRVAHRERPRKRKYLDRSKNESKPTWTPLLWFHG